MQDQQARTEVIRALEQVLSTPIFQEAPKMSAFLEYVVLKTLDGDSSRIKAYTIAVDALGKPNDFDPQGDPSVRVMAHRLRKALTTHYECPSNHEIEIVMTVGRYVPEFIFSSQEKLDRSISCAS